MEYTVLGQRGDCSIFGEVAVNWVIDTFPRVHVMLPRLDSHDDILEVKMNHS